MKFDIYRRFQLVILREDDQWVVYDAQPGKRVRNNLVIPADVAADELPAYLDDIYHELARPGDTVTPVS
ncbi:hypothetical protein LMG3458_02754 [Achromobacter deleyi]|uniref:DUF7661 domain-containing protein n=1 Tax=Achromobacter deleyi TaxID=1353891 RepID=A0A6S6ZY28_9BURK|nr:MULTISPECIES: hypothetical protein [Achromobacter]CAB3702874.1 hypothetical protein LMG3458_02754 [Achromobacter deleyi]CAB3858113.1 hypothetical protein LMG3482_02126 [Achromobacter deleyi]CAB3883086.1 hypothetical protein LMG3412_03361 [Achromobacter deleyi]CAB3884133.1 hypothetical protein LMG3481_03414 [Achromobacter deleyi]